jgi:chromosome segregation ATPase
MNEQEQAELAELKARQVRLEQELASLSTQLKQFENRLANPDSSRDRISGQPAPPRVSTVSASAQSGVTYQPSSPNSS